MVRVIADVRQHMRRLARIALAKALLVLGGAAWSQEPRLLQLLTNPEQYDGRRVVVFGYCRIEFESSAIHLHKEDYLHGLGNMVWLDFSSFDDLSPERRKIDYCLVEGTYNAKNHGHMGMFVGAIENIKRYEAWPPRPRSSKGKH
jgi:hypothetical protein